MRNLILCFILIFKYEEYGFNFNTNKDRSEQASANKVIDNIFIDGLYKYSDYSWIVQKEQKWFKNKDFTISKLNNFPCRFDERSNQIGEWAEKAYLLVHQNYKKTQTFF